MCRIFSMITWTGRATTFLVGLSVVLALTFGAASTALAGKNNDSALKLGVQNAVKATTSMVGTLSGPVLKLDNNGAGPALGLEVQDGGAPLTVNEGAGTATGLSADELDGKSAEAFLPTKLYKVDREIIVEGDGGTVTQASSVNCDGGDLALAGGYVGTGPDTQITTESFNFGPGSQNFWGFNLKNFSSQDDPVRLSVNCADLPPTR